MTYISTLSTYMGHKLLHYIHCTCIYIVTRKKLSEKHLAVCKRQEKKVSQSTISNKQNTMTRVD